jgi:hypothetical protein
MSRLSIPSSRSPSAESQSSAVDSTDRQGEPGVRSRCVGTGDPLGVRRRGGCSGQLPMD